MARRSAGITEAQLELLENNQRSAAVGGKGPRLHQERANLPENILEEQINGYLHSRLWKTIRQQSGLWIPYHQVAGKEVVKVSTLRPHRFSLKHEGVADWVGVRPSAPRRNAEFFIYEVKGGGRAPSKEQLLYLEKHAACGFLAGWFDDFDGDWDTSFLLWYRHWFGD